MTGHVHAEAMRLYAEDAAETDRPWERWEFRSESTDLSWISFPQRNPVWGANAEYRRKPKTIRIGEFDVPEPMRDEPQEEGEYFYPRISCLSFSVLRSYWFGLASDKRMLSSGLCHTTKEAAQLHLDALLSFTRQDK